MKKCSKNYNTRAQPFVLLTKPSTLFPGSLILPPPWGSLQEGGGGGVRDPGNEVDETFCLLTFYLL